MIIYKGPPTRYYNEDLSKQIDLFEATFGNHKKFVGQTMINGKAPFQFIIEADRIEEAFVKYDEVLESELKVIREEYEKTQSDIVMPDKNLQLIK